MMENGDDRCGVIKKDERRQENSWKGKYKRKESRIEYNRIEQNGRE